MTDLERAIYDAGVAVGRREGAAEMREQAAQAAARYEAPIWSVMIAAAIRTLPLTPEEKP